MNTTFKSCLTPEQSATLRVKGISADKASEKTPDWNDINNTGKPLERRELLPIFTLADIISLLPKGISTNNLYIDFLSNGKVESGYRGERKSFGILYLVIGDELIDALYELLLWIIDNGYLLTK